MKKKKKPTNKIFGIVCDRQKIHTVLFPAALQQFRLHSEELAHRDYSFQQQILMETLYNTNQGFSDNTVLYRNVPGDTGKTMMA